jgi:hypothetical protein
MCRVADDKEMKKHYVFAKASLEHPEVKEWVKAEGIRGIPHLSLYDGTGALKHVSPFLARQKEAKKR